MWGPTGITRLFNDEMGGQVSWLIPAALIAIVGLLVVTLRARRTDKIRAATILWGSWLVVTGLVFSFAAGIIHPYYNVVLAPPIGALIGIGGVRPQSRGRVWAPRRPRTGCDDQRGLGVLPPGAHCPAGIRGSGTQSSRAAR